MSAGSLLTERLTELAKQQDILLHGTNICNREPQSHGKDETAIRIGPPNELNA